MEYYIYIMTNQPHGTLYIGVTNNLIRRVYEHRESLVEGFTKKYALKQLVYYEMCQDVNVAIQREKSLKRWPRQWKIDLINKVNSSWKDLWNDILGSSGQARG